MNLLLSIYNNKLHLPMFIYLFISLLAIVLLLVYIVVEYRKKYVFNEYVDLNTSLDFNIVSNLDSKNTYGLLLFNIAGIRKEARALCIEKIRIHNSSLRIKSSNTISTKLPIPDSGIVLSVGVRKSRSFSIAANQNFYVSISGFLLKDRKSKLAFKQKLPVKVI